MTMIATQVMKVEHRTIIIVVKTLGNLALAIEKGQRADVALLKMVVEFFRVYADKLHHGKEEALFFPMLVKRGVPLQGCSISDLIQEHVMGRALVGALEEGITCYEQGKSGAQDSLVQTLRKIADLYQNHIRKENSMVFPMADKILIEADQKELSEKFVEVDKSVGFEVITRLEQFAKGLPSVVMQSSTTSNGMPSGSCGRGCSI
jgi:hemerythrin-like domain-containing protein